MRFSPRMWKMPFDEARRVAMEENQQPTAVRASIERAVSLGYLIPATVVRTMLDEAKAERIGIPSRDGRDS